MEILAVHAAASVDGNEPAASDWQVVTLPDDWNRSHPDFAGGRIWYRIDWRRSCPGAAMGPVALLLRSVVMAGEVFVNGQHLWSDERLTEPLSRSWNMPRQWILPESWLHDGVNTIEVRVVGVGGGQSAGLGAVFLGDSRQIGRLHDDFWWRYRTLFEVNIIVSGVVGILFLCIWIVRRRQTTYGWYAFSSLFWMAFIANILVTSPWPLPDTLSVARINIVMLLLSIGSFCMFTLRFGEQRLPRTERLMWAAIAGLVLLLLAAPDALVGKTQLFCVLIAALFFLLNCVSFVIRALRTRRREHLMLAFCLLVLPVFSIHDLLILLKLIAAHPILPYANIITTVSLSGVLGLLHAQNARRIERFNIDLTDSVAEARTQLATMLEREHVLALANSRLQERLQVAHDLHDGLGGSLVHMMASVEQRNGPLPQPQVMSMLKLIRDDLRQTIDSNSSAGVKVPATPREWIAPLRHRFDTLFDELGMSAEWQSPEQWLTPPTAQQCLALTRLVEEALTNVIKHSRARQIRLLLEQPDPDGLILRIEDNGIGFDVAAVRQAGISVGMRSMSTRIARVGGTLDVVSEPGRTALTACLSFSEARSAPGLFRQG